MTAAIIGKGVNDMLDIDTAIKHCLEVAEKQEDNAKDCNSFDEWTETEYYDKESCLQCAADHRQLAEWLTELKDLREENEQLKRILKVAISNIYKKCSCENSDCDICETETTCDYDNRFTWRLEKEAFDLIYKRGDKNDN